MQKQSYSAGCRLCHRVVQPELHSAAASTLPSNAGNSSLDTVCKCSALD